MRNAFARRVTELARERPELVVLAGDVGFGVLDELVSRCPGQFVNCGIAEQNMIGVAAGLALSGRTVVLYSIVNFVTLRCLEQIRNDLCYHGAEVKVVAVGGGFAYGAHGYTHHGVEDLAVMRCLPGMTVFAAGDPHEARAATDAIMATRGPCYLRLGKGGEPPVHDGPVRVEAGRALTVREGTEAWVLTTGTTLGDVLPVVDGLRAQGRSVGLASMVSLQPLDEAFLARVGSSARLVVTVEEHGPRGGLGEAVGACLARGGCRCALVTLGAAQGLDRRSGGRAYMCSFLDRLPAVLAAVPDGATGGTQ